MIIPLKIVTSFRVGKVWQIRVQVMLNLIRSVQIRQTHNKWVLIMHLNSLIFSQNQAKEACIEQHRLINLLNKSNRKTLITYLKLLKKAVWERKSNYRKRTKQIQTQIKKKNKNLSVLKNSSSIIFLKSRQTTRVNKKAQRISQCQCSNAGHKPSKISLRKQSFTLLKISFASFLLILQISVSKSLTLKKA